MDELRLLQNELKESAPVLVAKALDKELGPGSSSVTLPATVNDLTSVVKKKKKPVAETSVEDAPAAAKRKAEDDAHDTSSEKKAKIGSETAHT